MTRLHRIIFSATPRDYYNLTMTYLRASDIYRPYGGLVKLDVKYPEEDRVEKLNALRRKTISKTKTAVWMVSQCTTNSKREFIASVSQFIVAAYI